MSKTTIEYRPDTGRFTIATVIKGRREPITRNVGAYEVAKIGDQDINEIAELAKMFPCRAHAVTRLRRAA